jgi:hypothetical protein
VFVMRGPVSLHVVRSSLSPTLHATPVLMVLAGPALALVVLSSVWWTDVSDVTVPLVVSSLLMACTLGYALDDPAAQTVDPSPVPLLVRRVMAVGPLTLCGGLAWWAAVALVRQSEPVAQVLFDRVALEALAFAMWTLALSAFGAAKVGSTSGGTTGMLGLVSIVALLFSVGQVVPPDWPLPSLQPDPHTGRWWWVVAAATIVFVWYSRDPAVIGRRGLRARWGRHSTGASAARHI